jgi:predicted nuclease of restriction endonuclease-like (RecB) superfamily
MRKDPRWRRRKRRTPRNENRPRKRLPLSGYEPFLAELKERIGTAQLRAAITINQELGHLYWQIGRDILVRQEEHGWGAKVIDRLSDDLRREFPGAESFSPRNLRYMQAFAEAWPDPKIVQEELAQIGYGNDS